MKKIVLFVFLFIGYQYAKADKANTLWQLANHAYQNKNYTAAINLYDSMIQQHIDNAELYYNAGNAYFKNHQMGMAVWCYEKAHQLAPNDEDVETNLKISNLRLIDKFEATPDFFLFLYWKNILHFFSSDTWCIIGISFLWIMLIGWLLYYFSFSYTAVGKWLIWLGLVLGILFSFIGWQSNLLSVNTKSAIIISSNSTIKAAPDVSSTDLFILHEGTKVLELKLSNGWRNIRLSDGKVGWCLTSDLKEI
ncbi:MAG: hypothetical protein RJA07_991 [Bacteroidota bacterium]|jgi:tetratricopeptide (TPR) repeat protein